MHLKQLGPQLRQIFFLNLVQENRASVHLNTASYKTAFSNNSNKIVKKILYLPSTIVLDKIILNGNDVKK